MLELKVKAAGIGIRSEDFPSTPIEDIILGWEAKKMLSYQQALPQLDAYLSKLSPVALGKDKRERDAGTQGMTPDEAAKYRQEQDDRKLGAPILKNISASAHVRLMGDLDRGRWVRAHGWPNPDAEEGKHEPIAGLEPALALEIIALMESPGAITTNDDPIWRYKRRFRATVKRKG